jgi:three-Cys-motif partner protein
LKGSPRVALDIANPFTSYVFVERDPQRIAELYALKAEYRMIRRIDVREGDANVALQAWLGSGLDWKHHRAVVFLDPFGMQVPWSTIQSLGKTKAIEVLLNFPLGMAIQRPLTRSGEIPPSWQISLDTFFGSQDWRQLAYEESSDLFGPRVTKASGSGLKLLEWYRERLRRIFGHVSTAVDKEHAWQSTLPSHMGGATQKGASWCRIHLEQRSADQKLDGTKPLGGRPHGRRLPGGGAGLHGAGGKQAREGICNDDRF